MIISGVVCGRPRRYALGFQVFPIVHELNTRLEDVGGGTKPKAVKDRVPRSQDSAGGTQSKASAFNSNAEDIVSKSAASTSNAQPHETNGGTRPEDSVDDGDSSHLEPRRLSAIPLLWMMKEAIKSNGGILFGDENARRQRFTVPKNHDDFPLDFDDARFYFGAGAEAGGMDIAKHREPDVQCPSYIAWKAARTPLPVSRMLSLLSFTRIERIHPRYVYAHHLKSRSILP